MGLTVAVEAAREPLREKLNKKVDLKAIFEAVKILESLKAKQIKIYFMVFLRSQKMIWRLSESF